MKTLKTVLLVLKKENQILLAKKKRGFGEGKYNGIGGKLESEETPDMAMIREAKEEIFVKPTEYKKVGLIEFYEYVKGEKTQVLLYLYIATKWEGNPKESEEVTPKWFEISNLPKEEMFPDDQYWLPLILEGKKIQGYFDYDEDWNICSYEIKEIIESYRA